MASQLVYVLTTLPKSQQFINEINELFDDFLWSGRGNKIKRHTMINDYPEGGLRMYMDQNNHGKWKVLFKAELQLYCGALFFQCNLKREDLDSYVL